MNKNWSKLRQHDKKIKRDVSTEIIEAKKTGCFLTEIDQNIQCPFTLQWPIPRSHLKDEPGKAIYSRAFIASNIPSVKYYFAIFPNGFSLRNREQTYISLYLEYHENIKAEAKFKISIETADYQCEENHVFEKSLGWKKMLCTTDELYDPEKRFIVNGEIVIKMEGVLIIEKEEILKPWKSGNFDDSLCLALWNQNESKDFTISVKGQEITAHKWVLALRSPVFEKMFESGMKEAKENKVGIPDFSFNIVEAAIKRCYHQSLANESTSLGTKMDMLQFFEKYDIQLLKTDLEAFLITEINESNVCRLTNCSLLSNSQILQKKCTQFLRDFKLTRKAFLLAAKRFKKMSGPNVFNLDVLRQSIAQLEEFKSGQMKKIREDQVQNSAGGFVFEVSDDIRVRRFIILGTTGGSYYATEKELTMENVTAIIEIIKKGKGALVLQEVLNISLAGRAPKQETTLFALALCAKASYFKRTDLGDAENLQYEKYLEMLQKTAASIVPKVCRIPTHLFGYVNYCEMIAKSVAEKSGWGRQMRRTIAEWYLNQEPKALAMHITKYPQRNGWSHTDLLRLSHPNVSKKSDNALLYDHLLSFAVHGELDLGKNDTNYTPPSKKKREYNVVPEKAQEVIQHESIKFLQNFLVLKKLTTEYDDVKKCTDLIREYGYVREHIPSDLLNSAVVWKTLLENMPMTALIRNLSKLSSLQIIDGSDNDNQKYVDLVISKITDEAALKKAKIHPLNVLIAAVQYRAGRGLKGKLTWDVNESISKALDDAFYKSFHNVEPTNKRFLLAFDVSGSMTSPIAGSQISCREASAALGMVAMRTEPIAETMCFHTDGFVPLNIKKDQSLPEIMDTMNRLPFGGTDCAQPMLWALENKKEFDVFIVYTDSETWYGDIHPFEAMKKYRKEMNIPDAKLIVMGMATNNFTIADPSDPNMLDVVGFDSGVPEVIRGFVLGEI